MLGFIFFIVKRQYEYTIIRSYELINLGQFPKYLITMFYVRDIMNKLQPIFKIICEFKFLLKNVFFWWS